EHITAVAADIKLHPVALVPTPFNINVDLDASAQHAQGWAKDYLAYLLTTDCNGRALATPGNAVLSIPVVRSANNTKPTTPGPPGKTTAPLTTPATGVDAISAGQVTVHMLNTISGYSVTLSLYQTPAGNATSYNRATGTAVAAVLNWRENSTGFAGVINVTAQTTAAVPWQASQQLGDVAATRLLRDGKKNNIEGTLEGLALQRAARAFAEIVDARGPVHHVLSVTIARPGGAIRAGDTVAVVRGDYVISEVSVTSLTNNNLTGNVIWGSHTHHDDDSVVKE
ncbi:MAG: hypothetical protein WCJ56_15240, partial [bacterium]